MLLRTLSGSGAARKLSEDTEAIKKLFTPEFRNRLDATIPFAGLSQPIIERVVEKFVLQLEAQLSDRNVTIEMTDAAKAWLGKKGFDPDYGARPLARIIQEHVKKPMADELLFGDLRKGGAVKVDLDAEADEGAGKLSFEFFPAPPQPEPTEDEVEDVEGDEGDAPDSDEKAPVT